MLTLNFDTWFMRKFLRYDRYSTTPKTICELGRVILGMSFLWLVCTTVALAVVSLYLTGVFGVFYVMFTDATLAEFFDFSVKGEATWTSMAWLIFILGNISLAVAGAIFGVKFAKEYREEKLEELARLNYEKNGVWEVPKTSTSPIKEFFKGVWARFHDKTCTMIQWENDPDTLRQREREKEEREWEERRAKLIAETISDSENNA